MALKIKSSNLMLRFYVSDGWTKEELTKHLVDGSVSIKHPQDKDPYFTLDSQSMFDAQSLLKAAPIVERAFNDYPHETDLQFIERMQ